MVGSILIIGSFIQPSPQVTGFDRIVMVIFAAPESIADNISPPGHVTLSQLVIAWSCAFLFYTAIFWIILTTWKWVRTSKI